MKIKKFKNFTSKVFTHRKGVTFSVDNLPEQNYRSLLNYCYNNFDDVNQDNVVFSWFDGTLSGYLLCK